LYLELKIASGHCERLDTGRRRTTLKAQQMAKIFSVAVLAVVGGSAVVNALAADLGKLVESCAECHGKDGASTDPHSPIISGFSAPYFADSMAAYAAKERPCPEAEYPGGPNKGKKTDMCKIAKDLSKSDIDALAGYFAGKPFVPAKQAFDAALAAKGKAVHKEHCEKCHSDGGSLASDDAGILAGQWQHYQRATLKAYMSGEREADKKMAQKIEKLDAEMMEQLVHYYSSLQ
jgi:cytochrome subunit of sulfide dehydrogenase